MHSLGVTEFLYLKKAIKRKDSKFFQDPQVKENLRFIKIGESGELKGIKERILYVREYARLKNHMGTEALYTFPLEDMNPSQMTEVYSAISSIREGYTTVPFVEMRSNDEFLTDGEREKKIEQDNIFRQAVLDRDYSKAEQIADERAVVLAEPLQAVFDGTTHRRDLRDQKMQLSYRGVVILFRALGNKQTRELKKLKNMGYTVDTFQAELDPMTPLSRIERFYRDPEEAKRHTLVMEQSPHTGIALQPELWARTIKASRNKTA